MSSSLPFVSSAFALQLVTQVGAQTIRVRYTTDPLALSSAGANDALNPANYQLTGPATVTVVGATTVAGDPQSIDVSVGIPLVAGVWTLLVNAAVQSETGVAISSPNAMAFTATTMASITEVTGGASNDTTESIIRKHLPRSFVGKAWDAIIAALATGDEKNTQNAISAFDQLFLSSASGVYLDRRAGENGIRRPDGVGMSDELFRKLAIKAGSRNVTAHTLLEILEIFYGEEALRAHLDTDVYEPYALQDGQSLKVYDGRTELEITFSSGDFGSISSANAAEVAAVINRQARGLLAAYAQTETDPISGKGRVRLYSSVLGLASVLQVTGGLAQNALQFPESVLSLPASVTLAISRPEVDVFRYTFTSADPLLLDVHVDDYVNVYTASVDPANRGSFKIINVSATWNGATWTNYFDVVNVAGVIQAGPLALSSDDDVKFFRPKRATLSNVAGRLVVLAKNLDGVTAVLPATAQAVGRDETTAAFLPATTIHALASVEVTGGGTALATTTSPHSLAVGDRVLLEGLYADATVPAVLAGNLASAGNPGTTEAAQTDLWSDVRSDLTARSNHAAAQLTSGDVLVVGGWDLAATYMTTCSRFRLTGSSVLTSGVANGRTAYDYNWIATAAIGTASADHRLTALQGAMADKVLLTGGRNGGGALATAQLYDAASNAWSNVPVGTLTARYWHDTVRVVDSDGADVVYIIGGLTAATTATGNVEKFTTAAGGTIAATALSESVARFAHKAVAITDTAFVVVGGLYIDGGLNEIPRDDCWGYDEATATLIPMGKLSVARAYHALVKISEGAVMAIGGYGRNLSSETVDRALDECEIWDSVTKVWRPAPKMRFPRRFANAVVINNKVYVFGGWDAANQPVTKTEVFDLATRKWLGTASTGDATIDAAGAVSVWNGLVFAHGGSTPASSPTNTAQVFIPGLTLGCKDLNNQEATVASVPSSSSFTFATSSGRYANFVDGSAIAVGGSPSDMPGPYVWSPLEGPAVTAVEATIQQTLDAGQQYRTVTVDDASDFPDAPGWLVMGFATDDEVYPVRYLGKASATIIMLDYSFVFPKNVPIGAKVVLLAQKGPYDPPHAEEDGSFYVTGSSAGRIAAQAALDASIAAGKKVNIVVAYPGDKGLGGAGLPATGQKLSDKVAVWGGDDLDAELEAARGE